MGKKTRARAKRAIKSPSTYTGAALLADVREDLAHAGKVLAGDDAAFDDWIKAWVAGDEWATNPMIVMPLLSLASKKVDELGARPGEADPPFLRARARADALCVAFAADGIAPEKRYRLRNGKPTGDAFVTVADNVNNLRLSLEALGLACE